MTKVRSSWMAILGAVCLLTVIAAPANARGTQETARACCVAGDYVGTISGKASLTCPEPEPANTKITMTISQIRGCGREVWGTADKVDQVPPQPVEWKGTVERVTGPNVLRCCDVKGTFGSERETTEFTIRLCFKKGKWSGKGTYKTVREKTICEGVMSISQK